MREWLPRKFEAQIAVSVGLGVAICMLWPKLQILATCTCALMCAQAGTAQSVRLGLLRLRGILLCGLTGVLIAFLHGLTGQAPLAYIPLAMAGTLLSLVLCRACGMAPMDCRVGCITYLLVIVATGSVAGTTRVVVNELREMGWKVGMIKLKSFRPFPKEFFASISGKYKALGVIDKSVSFGYDGTIYGDVKSSMYGSGDTKMANFICGLGGRDVSKDMIAEMFEVLRNLSEGKPEDEVQFIGKRW